MSDEHVIPESLGGFYHIYNVCRPCNSRMGETIDSALVNHKLTELYRFCEGLEGKNGYVPNPFSGVATAIENMDAKARAFIDEDQKLKYELLPRVVVNEEDGIVKSIEISVDAANEGAIRHILQKKLERLGLGDAAVGEGKFVRSVMDGGFSSRWTIDTSKFKIGLLKIAYEFAIDSIGSFCGDDNSLEIARILREADHGAVERFVKIGSGLQPEIFEPFAEYLDLDSKKHYLVLMQTEMGLVCLIKLHGLFSIGVVLSPRGHLVGHDAIIGINDIKGRRFRKVSFEELVKECMGPVHSRLGYSFASEAEKNAALVEINSPGFLYETDVNGDAQFFLANGSAYSRPFSQVLETANFSNKRQEDWNVQLFSLDRSEELFVKSVATGNMYRVEAVEVSRQFIKRI